MFKGAAWDMAANWGPGEGPAGGAPEPADPVSLLLHGAWGRALTATSFSPPPFAHEAAVLIQLSNQEHLAPGIPRNPRLHIVH